MGETWVPYGNTVVRYSEDYACAHGYEGDCPDELWMTEEERGRAKTYEGGQLHAYGGD